MNRSTALFLGPLFVYHWLSHARSEARDLCPAGNRRPPDLLALIRRLRSIGFPIADHQLSLDRPGARAQRRPDLFGTTVVIHVKDSRP